MVNEMEWRRKNQYGLWEKDGNKDKKGSLRWKIGKESARHICKNIVCGPMRHGHSAAEGYSQRTYQTSSWEPVASKSEALSTHRSLALDSL